MAQSPRYQEAQIQVLTKSTNALADLGLNYEGFDVISISGINQTIGQEPHYQSYIHVEQGIIVILRAYRSDDRKMQGGEPAYFSETLFQQWVQVTQFQKITEPPPPQKVYIYHVREENLTKILLEFHMDELTTRHYARGTNEFNQISQTPFGKAIRKCLQDHFSQMSIQSIEVRTRKPGIRGLQPPFDVLFSLEKTQ